MSLKPPVTPPRQGARLWLIARVAITVVAFAFLIRLVSAEQLLAAVRRIPLRALALCLLAVFAAQVMGAMRFRLLLETYGAERQLSRLEALRLHLVSVFYNTYLPGAIAGDLVRATAVRSCFDANGLTSALAVSFVERVMGFAGVLILTATVSVVQPIPGIRGLLPFSLLGLTAAMAGIAGLAFGRRLSRFLPRRLAAIVDGLPALQNVRAFVLAAVVSVLTHMCVSFGFHAIISSLTSSATLAQSMVIVPLASTAMYIPATIAGAGTRDAAFVFLYHGVGVSQADALAMSLSVLFCTFLVAGLGGIANAIPPFEASARA